MADSSKYVAIRRVTTSTTNWVDIVCPIDCSQVVIENVDSTNAQAVRTDKVDGTTEKTLPATLELTLRASMQCWSKDDVVCSVLATSGSGPVVVSFIR